MTVDEINKKLSSPKGVPEDAGELYDFFMQAPVPLVILLGPHHRFLLANPHYEQFVGRKVEGKTVLEVFTLEEVGDFVKLLDEVYKTGIPRVDQELPLSLPDENGVIQIRFIKIGYHPFREADGTIKGVLAVHQDVTDQVLARRSIEKLAGDLQISVRQQSSLLEEVRASKTAVENERENFRNLFRQTPEMVCILRGPEHIFEFVNEAHVKVLGFDATGMSVREAQPESVEVHGLLDEVYRTGKTAELHEIPVTVSARLRQFNLTYAARKSTAGEIDGVMILGVEVTDQVQSREQLQLAVRARDEFLSIASHELKTPLTSLKLQIQMSEVRLKKLQNTPELEKLAKAFEISNNQVDKLTKLIEDLLDISRIKAGKLSYNFEKTNFSSIYDELIERFAEQLHASKIRIESKLDKTLEGYWDKNRLEQVIINLISNAIKYAPASPIEISAQKHDQNAVISIRDFGQGIPADKRDRIFKRFERISDSKAIGGLGLGLYISKQIVAAHGGTIELDPAINDGARFVVTIPMDARA